MRPTSGQCSMRYAAPDRRGRLTVQPAGEGAAVDECGRHDTGEPGEGGREVDVADQGARRRPRLHARATHEQRYPDVLVECRLLPGREAVLAVVEAVVGGEDDVRVAQLPGARQITNQRHHAAIHRQQRRAPAVEQRTRPLLHLRRHARDGPEPARLVAGVRLVERRRSWQRCAAEPGEIARGRRRRAMRCVEREIEEERAVLGARPRDEPARVSEVHGRAVVGPGEPVVDEPSVDVQAIAVLVVRVARDGRDPLVPPRRPVRLRRGVGEAVEVLADESGAVPGPVEPRRDGRALDAEAMRGLESAVGATVGLDAGVVGVLPAQDRRARRAAERVAHHRAREGHAVLPDHPLHPRHGVQIGTGHVVGEDEQDVRSHRRAAGRSGAHGRGAGCADGTDGTDDGDDGEHDDRGATDQDVREEHGRALCPVGGYVEPSPGGRSSAGDRPGARAEGGT